MAIPQEVLAYGWIPFTVVVVVSNMSYETPTQAPPSIIGYHMTASKSLIISLTLNVVLWSLCVCHLYM